MTLIEEEEIAVIVKKTLADALPLSNTPGPVDVTGEEGFAALSLLYIDARGDLFIKEQQNQPLVWDGTDVTIGPTNSEHITISPSAIDFKDGDDVLTIITPGAITVGDTGAGNKNIKITNDQINLRENETDIVTFSITLNAPSLKFEDVGSTKFWEFRKDYNTNEFTVRPETNSIFKFMDDSGTTTTTLGIDTTDTTFNGGSKTNNSIVTQHMGQTSGMPINSIMGGTDEVYVDGATVDLFGFTLATSQVMYCDLTIMSWSPGATQEAQGVSRWRIIIYKDDANNVYPSSDSDKVDEVEAWREFDTVTSDTVAIAAGGGTNEYKITADREYTASPAGQTRLVYKADIIGTATAITNLQV